MTKLNTLPILKFKTSESDENWIEMHHDNSIGLWIKYSRKSRKNFIPMKIPVGN